MTSNNWLSSLINSEKTAIIQDGKRKVHFLFEDDREMVEEYNLDTNVVTRRAWRLKSNLGDCAGWSVEIGDPEPKKDDNLDVSGIRESSNAPFVTRRITKTNLEWRIRNLPYPADVYSITADSNDNSIIVKTSNKKYFKKLSVPDLDRAGVKVEQQRIEFSHKFNTLIITYTKPPELLDLEKKILKEVLKLKTRKEGEVQCPTS